MYPGERALNFVVDDAYAFVYAQAGFSQDDLWASG